MVDRAVNHLGEWGSMTTQDHDVSLIRLVVVDDHDQVRGYLSDVLSAHPDLIVIGEAATLTEAEHVIASLEPDIVVLDWNLPDGNALQLLHRNGIAPSTTCIIHAGTITNDDSEAAIQAGAAAVVLKGLSGTELVDTIRRIRPETP